MADQSGLTQSQSKAALEAFINTVQSTVASGDSVSLIGFGAFSRGNRAARVGINPSTGATINIAASNTFKFKPGSVSKACVNK